MDIPGNLMLQNREEYLKLIGATGETHGLFLPEEERLSELRRDREIAYICVYGENNVSAVDINAARKLFDIPVGSGPLDIAVNRQGRTAYVSNFFSNTISVLDLRRGAAIATVPVGANPAGVRLSHNGWFLYVVHYGEPSVYVLNAHTYEKLAEIPLPAIGFMIDITADDALAFVCLREAAEVAVIDLTVNLVVKVIPAGAGTEDVRISPNERLAFVSNEDANTLTAVNVQLAEPAVPVIPARAMPVGLAYTRGGCTLYCANRADNSVSVYNVFTHSELVRIPGGQGPYGVETANGDRQLVVTNSYERTASIINTRDNAVAATVTVGYAPAFLAVV